MTFKKLKEEVIGAISDSNVNLGRKGTKTRDEFISLIENIFRDYAKSQKKKNKTEPELEPESEKVDPHSDKVMKITPDRRSVMDIGHGAIGMSGRDSMAADEQLNRSPYGANKGE